MKADVSNQPQNSPALSPWYRELLECTRQGRTYQAKFDRSCCVKVGRVQRMLYTVRAFRDRVLFRLIRFHASLTNL